MNELEKMNAWANKINKKNKKKYGGLRPPMNYNSGNPLINNSIFNSQYGDKDVDSTSLIKNIIDVNGGIGGDISVMGANSSDGTNNSTSNNAVGGDSGASASVGESLIESSISKLNDYLQSGNICFITANKSYRWLKDEYHDSIEDISSNKIIRVLQSINRERNKSLENDIRGMGYTYFKVDGSYENQERKQNYISSNNISDVDNYNFTSDEKKLFTDKEESFAVIDKFNNYDSFLSNMEKLMNKYNQESILIFRVNDKSGRFIYSDGQEEVISGYSFGKDFPFKSLISGRPFVVESISDEIYYRRKGMNQFNSSNFTLDENSNRYRKVKKSLYGDPSCKIKSFAIISPQNPLGWKDSTEEEFINKFKMWTNNKSKYNKMSNDELLSRIDDFKNNIESNGNRALRYGHFSYVPLKGHYGDSEKSYLIFNLTLNDAKIIARDYGQESFFYGEVHFNDSIISYYVTNNACQSYELIETSKTVTDESEANDFYSKFGCKFRINMREFGDDVPELEEDINSTFMSRARNRNTGFDSTYVTKQKSTNESIYYKDNELDDFMKDYKIAHDLDNEDFDDDFVKLDKLNS